MPRSLLVVDSSAVVAHAIGAAGMPFGLAPVCVSDFQGATGVLAGETPALVVTGFELNGLPGASLVAAMRASPAHRVVPAIFVTSRSLGKGVETRLGCPIVVKSPRLREEIAAKIEELGFARAAGGPAPGGDALRGRRLLVAEDTEAMRRLISHRLHLRGASVTLANDGFEASVAGLSGGFDLIVLDIEMPRLDGRDAARLLRESGVRTPIVALTAHDDPGLLGELVERWGFDAVISKENAIEALAAGMPAWCGGRAA
jgi:CheY-like chemotaxis protein